MPSTDAFASCPYPLCDVETVGGVLCHVHQHVADYHVLREQLRKFREHIAGPCYGPPYVATDEWCACCTDNLRYFDALFGRTPT